MCCTGDNAGQYNDIRITVIDHSTQNAVNEGKNWEEIQSSVDCISSFSWEELACKKRSDEEHGDKGEGVEYEHHGEERVDSFLCAM